MSTLKATATLNRTPLGRTVTIDEIAGPRPFRRRLMEMGLVPGTAVKVVEATPLGGSLQLEVRHSRLSIRRAAAAYIAVR